MDKHLQSKVRNTKAKNLVHIVHAKNESNIYNKLFMLAYPIHITIMLHM